MFAPDYGTIQLLHKLRVAEMQRKRRGRAATFEMDSGAVENPLSRVRRWLRRSQASQPTNYIPARQNS